MDSRFQNTVTLLITGAAIVGFIHGLKLAHLQVALEGAQVLSGLVEYPAQSPQHIYHSKLWTLLNQIPALFLFLGVSERVLSIAISGLGGALFYIGLALVSFAVNKKLFLSVVAPSVILWTGVAGAISGINYPVVLLNSPHTYGSFGLSFCVLVLGLIGCGRLRSAALIAGLTLSVHPSWGVWINSLLIPLMLYEFRKERLVLFEKIGWWLIGAAISAMSLMWWYFYVPGIEFSATSEIGKYTTVFIEKWDFHRKPISLSANNPDLMSHLWCLTVIACASLLAGYNVFRSTSSTDLAEKLFFKIAFYSSIGSVIFILILLLPQDLIPSVLMMLMPNRWANLGIIIFLPLLIGTLVAGCRKHCAIHYLLAISAILIFKDIDKYGVASFLLTFLLVFVAVAIHFGESRTNYNLKSVINMVSVAFLSLTLFLSIINPGDSRVMQAALLTSISLALVWIISVQPRNVFLGAVWARLFLKAQEISQEIGFKRKPSSVMSLPTPVDQLTALFALMLLCAYFGLSVGRYPPWEEPAFSDRTNNQFWNKVEEQEGMLLADPGLFMVQARSRRPVLIDGGALDWLPYVPRAAPYVAEILSEVYGVDYFNPPQHHRGRLDRSWSAEYWQELSTEDWQKLSRKYGFSNVLVTKKWIINLPVLVSDESGLALYKIPGEPIDH